MTTRSIHSLAKIALLTAMLAGIESHAVTLVFDKHVEIRGRNIRLKDIARVEDAGVWTSKLGDIDLGKSPPVGRTERLQAEQITRWVRNRFPQLEKIEWRGAKELMLHTASRVVPADLLVSKALETLAASPMGREQWRVLPEHPVKDLTAPDAPYVLEAKTIRATKGCERVMVRVDAKSDGWILASTTVWLMNERTPHAAGEGERKSEHFATGLSPVSQGVGRCSWLQGDELKWQAENTPAVTRMELVTVEMHTPALSIETKGIALGNGKVGEMVRVRRLGASDMFMATVSGKARVSIVEGVVQ